MLIQYLQVIWPPYSITSVWIVMKCHIFPWHLWVPISWNWNIYWELTADLPSFPQLLWNSRIFVCFHALCMKWLSSCIFKLNLLRFLPVGQLLPFLVQCVLFANASTQKSWEVLKMCVSITYQKETKSWETPKPEERYFLPFGKEEWC
jgi:hypothetical protein